MTHGQQLKWEIPITRNGMPFHLKLFATLCFLAATVPVRATDWSIDVVPESSKKGVQTISLQTPFYVVLTNISGHDLLLWKEWCSDGYFNLSFEFTGKDGKAIAVTKDPMRDWARNFPDGFVVKSGRHFVLPVTFISNQDTADKWVNTKSLYDVMVMKAVYRNPPFARTELKINGKPASDSQWNDVIGGSWNGLVESEPLQVKIER